MVNSKNKSALFNIPCGLFVVTGCVNGKDFGCIVNTAMQITDTPKRIIISVNNNNFTAKGIEKTKKFNLSVLTNTAPFELIENFGFKSSENFNKFESCKNYISRLENGLIYLNRCSNACISATVVQTVKYQTHTVFVAEVTFSEVLNSEVSLSYEYYLQNIKPKVNSNKTGGFVCKICGYVYNGNELPENYICPVCKHPAEDFEPIN